MRIAWYLVCYCGVAKYYLVGVAVVVGVVLPPVVVHPLVEVVGDVEAAVVVGGELEVNQHHGVAVVRLLPAQTISYCN